MRRWCRYVITVHTSDLRGAGTDANVFLALTGKATDGKMLSLPEMRLDNDRNNFERGALCLLGTGRQRAALERRTRPYVPGKEHEGLEAKSIGQR